MATQSLTWNGKFGRFANPLNWAPEEAPTPGVNQNLKFLGGVAEVTAPLTGYDIDLLPGGASTLTLIGGATPNELVIGGGTTVTQTAASGGINVLAGVVNRGTLEFGGSGLDTNTTITLNAGSSLVNDATIKAHGNVTFVGTGSFVNNGSVAVDGGGVVVLRGVTGGSDTATYQIEDGGLLQIVGITLGTVAFVKGEAGNLRFDLPNAQNSLRGVYNFDGDDTIRVAGTATDKVWQADPAGGGGTLVLTGAGQVKLRGDFSSAAQFTLDTQSEPGSTLIKTTKAAEKPVVVVAPEPQPPGPGPAPQKPTLVTNDSVLDMSRYGRKDATVEGSGSDLTINLHNVAVKGAAISRADFIDGSLYFDASSPGGRYVPDADASAIARLYYTQLGRAPEFAGLKYWVDTLEAQDWNVSDVADDFYNSREFQTRFGTNQSNAQYVDQLYRNILGRPGEREGQEFWTGQLNAGVGRDVVAVVGFSESIEHKAIRFASIEGGGIAFIDHPFL